MFFGVFISFNGMVLPDYWAGEYIHFGRMRPVNVIMSYSYGFCQPILVSCITSRKGCAA